MGFVQRLAEKRLRDLYKLARAVNGIPEETTYDQFKKAFADNIEKKGGKQNVD